MKITFCSELGLDCLQDYYRMKKKDGDYFMLAYNDIPGPYVCYDHWEKYLAINSRSLRSSSNQAIHVFAIASIVEHFFSGPNSNIETRLKLNVTFCLFQ